LCYKFVLLPPKDPAKQRAGKPRKRVRYPKEENNIGILLEREKYDGGNVVISLIT
jgi:hypothetical protein